MKRTKPILFNYILLSFFFICFSLFSFAQGTVSGSVKDANGEGLIGVTVVVKGKTIGTSTDLNGNYTLMVPAGTQTLVYSYIGYSTQQATLTVEDGKAYTSDVRMGLDNLSLDEIVVTGTFSERTQKDSPMSVTLINSKRLEQLASNSQADILRTIPGITAEGGGGEVASNVFVRGMPSGGQYQYTPLQVDGLPVLSTFGLNSSAHDVYFRNDLGIRNLEFVRGGSSTLFGAGSVAGIINYTSVTGSAEHDNKVQLEWADGGRLRTDFLTSGPLSENLFYAFSGFYRYDEGPLFTGLPTRGHQIRGNIKKLFNDGNSSFIVSGQFIDDNVQFYLPYPLANENDQRERPIGNDGEEVFTLQTSNAANFSFDTPFGRFESPIGDGVTTTGGYLMFDLKHSFGNDWRLYHKSKAAKYDHWFNLFLDGDGNYANSPISADTYVGLSGDQFTSGVFTYADDGSALGENDLVFRNRILDRRRPMEELSGETYLTKTIDNHNISFGTFLANTKAADDNWLSFFVGDFRNAPRMLNITLTDTAGNVVQHATNGFVSGSQTSNRDHESSKVAFFIGDEIKGEKLDIDIGARWERASGFINREVGVGSNVYQRATVSASDFALALAALYRLSNSTNLYANVSRGYFFPQLRSVSFVSTDDFSSLSETETYDTESIIQGEVGVKYGQNALAFTAAAFYVALGDRRNVDFVDVDGVLSEVVSVQSTQTIGVEANVNYNITRGLNAYGNFTFQDHEFTEVENDPDLVGNELRRQPNVMGMVGLAYDDNGFDLNVSSNFLGSKFANDANTVELDGFNIVRLDAGYRFYLGTNESLRVGVSVFNLLDEAGITEGSPRQGDSQVGTGDFFVGRPILPRRVFVRTTFDF